MLSRPDISDQVLQALHVLSFFLFLQETCCICAFHLVSLYLYFETMDFSPLRHGLEMFLFFPIAIEDATYRNIPILCCFLAETYLVMMLTLDQNCLEILDQIESRENNS